MTSAHPCETTWDVCYHTCWDSDEMLLCDYLLLFNTLMGVQMEEITQPAHEKIIKQEENNRKVCLFYVYCCCKCALKEQSPACEVYGNLNRWQGKTTNEVQQKYYLPSLNISINFQYKLSFTAQKCKTLCQM